MSDSEEFLARWSRLKRESGLVKSDIKEERAPDALPDSPPVPGVDLTSLPTIESIVADSDVRPFLQAGVPEELTRAALRSAWTADPAICGFIGIAENQWDFNGEATIPGFGPLEPTDHAYDFVTRAFGGVDNAVERTLEGAGAVDSLPLPSTDPEGRKSAADNLQVASAPTHASLDADAVSHVKISNTESDTLTDTPESSLAPRAERTHGGALPQ